MAEPDPNSRGEFPLVLGVKREAWRGSTPDQDDYREMNEEAFKQKRPRIIKRDNGVCRACGFRASKYLECHHVDGDHTNHHDSNLITLCPLCHSVFHIGFAGMHSLGTLIYAPEITQASIHQIVHAIWFFEYHYVEGKGFPGYSTPADASNIMAGLYGYYDVLRMRQYVLEDAVGNGGSDPLILSQWLSGLSDPAYEMREQVIGDWRFLPSLRGWGKQRTAWGKVVYSKYAPSAWPSVIKQNENIVKVVEQMRNENEGVE